MKNPSSAIRPVRLTIAALLLAGLGWGSTAANRTLASHTIASRMPVSHAISGHPIAHHTPAGRAIDHHTPLNNTPLSLVPAGRRPAGQTQSPTAGQALRLDFVGQLGGLTTAVDVVGDFAYVARGLRLVVVDVRNPVAPVDVGQTAVMQGAIKGIDAEGGFVYVADGAYGLHVVDVTNPAAPLIVGQVDTPGYAVDVFAVGNFAYLALGNYAYSPDGKSGLQVIDVADRAHPRIVATVGTPSIAASVFVDGGTAYLAVPDGGLRVIDVRDPASPKELGAWREIGVSVDNVFVSGHIAYVGTFGYNSEVRMIDVSDPAAPRPLSPGNHFNVEDGRAGGLVVSDGYAFVGAGGRGVAVVDVGRPLANPGTVWFVDTPGIPTDIKVANGHAYVADLDGGLRVFAVQPAGVPHFLGTLAESNVAFDLAAANGYVYAVDETSGLRVIDARDGAAPRRGGQIDTPGSPWSIALSGTLAFVADDTGGLRVIDVGDPSQLREVGTTEAAVGAVYSVATDGTYAYVIGDGDQLSVMDVAIPASPRPMGSVFLPGASVAHLAAANGYAYLATINRGLRAIDASNPAAPHEVWAFERPELQNNAGTDVAVGGTVLYYVNSRDGLWLFDISTPSVPRELAHVLSTGLFLPSRVKVDSDIVFAYNRYGRGPTVFDAANPANPRVLGTLAGTVLNGLSTMAVARGRLYTMIGGTAGFRVYDVGMPRAVIEQAVAAPAWNARDVAVAGNNAFVTTGQGGGLLTVDVRDPYNPRLMAALALTGTAQGVAVQDGVAFVAGGEEGGLRVVDVRAAGSPRELSSVDTPGEAVGVTVAGAHAYVADQEGGLRLIDVLDPVVPHEVGALTVATESGRYQAQAVSVVGSNAYVAFGPGFARVIDVRLPAAPHETAELRPSSQNMVTDVQANGDLAYLLVSRTGLSVFDVSDLTQPREVGSLTSTNEHTTLAVTGKRVYMAGTYTLDAVDVAQPASPVLLATLRLPVVAQGITAVDDLAYIAAGDGGLLVARLSSSPVPPAAEPIYLPRVFRR